MSATTEHPKVFISYSWSGSEHEQDVIELATTLRNHGVDAILDKWDLKPGQDKFVFMESMVTDASVVKVLVLCDQRYQEKANNRSGGVGTESQIISQELYTRVQQTKFIPVVFEYDDVGEPCLPVFMKGRIYVDLSSTDRYGAGLDELLRLIYEQPFHQKPALGAAPAFLKPDGGLPYAKELGAALKAVQDGKANRYGLECLFVEAVLNVVKNLYVESAGDDYHEAIFQAIQKTKGLRDQFAEYFDVIAAFSGDDPRVLTPSYQLLEGLGLNFGPPERDGTYYPGWSDTFGFVALESLLLLTAALLRHERWSLLKQLLRRTFIVRTDHNGPASSNFVVFDRWLCSMDEHRNSQLRLNRASVTADLIKERCSPEKTSFAELMQADVFLALAAAVRIDDVASETSQVNFWAPRTAVYYPNSRPLQLFMRAEDSEFRANIRIAMGVNSAEDMAKRVESARAKLEDFSALSVGRGFNRFNMIRATNLQLLLRE
jgi:hypothetical protein